MTFYVSPNTIYTLSFVVLGGLIAFVSPILIRAIQSVRRRRNG